MNNNKTLVLVIALLLAGILGVMVYKETRQTPGEKIEAGLNDAASGLGAFIASAANLVRCTARVQGGDLGKLRARQLAAQGALRREVFDEAIEPGHQRTRRA